MTEEKVMHIKLPDGAKYRRVEVTEDGSIDIVYTEECVNEKETIEISRALIPKPKPLIGGTEVYLKNDSSAGNYWFCKIKGDEFMHVYFDDLTEDDLFYYSNGQKRDCLDDDFKDKVLKALKNKPKEGYRWIPVFEPSKDQKTGRLQYVSGADVLDGFNCHDWKKMFKEYSPENGSQLASITTYFLLILRWLKDNYAGIKEFARNSSMLGNYADNIVARNYCEKTGEMEFGGLFGFIGNTTKIIKDAETSSGFSLVGGSWQSEGWRTSVASVRDIDDSLTEFHFKDCVGILELTK